jgi:hypothetical protein
VPELLAPQYAGLLVGDPDGAERPAQRIANLLKDVWRGGAEGDGLGEHSSHTVLDGEAAFGPFPEGDVARDPERAGDRAGFVAQALLGGRNPRRRAINPGLLFLPADHRLSRGQYPLLILQGGLGMFGGKKVRVAAADRFVGAFEAKGGGHRLVDADEPALTILEIDVVGDGIHERIDHFALGGQRRFAASASGDFRLERLVRAGQLGGAFGNHAMHAGAPAQRGREIRHSQPGDQQAAE